MKKLPHLNSYIGDLFFFFFLLIVAFLCAQITLFFMPKDYTPNSEVLNGAGKYAPFLLGLLSPLIETLLSQALPALIGQMYLKRLYQRWLIIVIPFSLLHFAAAAPLASLLHGFFGGLILGYMYFRYMDKSHYKAILMTWLLHSSINLLALTGS